MAVFNSQAISQNLPVPGFGAGGGQVRCQYTKVSLPVGATTTDTINLFRMPENFRVVDIRVKYPAFGGSTTLNIGDGGFTQPDGTVLAADPDRYFAAGSIATAGNSDAIANTGLFVNGPKGRYLTITAALAAGTVGTAGDLEVALFYTVQEPQA